MSTTEPSRRQPRDEDPALAFSQYAIAYHFCAKWCGDETGPRDRGDEPLERAMGSYEDDMLLYAHRSDTPFTTRVFPPTADVVTVRFPPELTYEAEGRRKTVRCFGATEEGRTRSFGIAFGETWFKRSELGVLTLVLTPAEPARDDSELNEYDVIKLVKLWEGGEGATRDEPPLVEGRDLWFATEPRQKLTLHDLAAPPFFPDWQPLAARLTQTEGPGEEVVTSARRGYYRVGTVELELPPSDWNRELFCDLAALKRRGEVPKPSSDGQRWARVVAVGGILQGLLDFQAIEEEELADVFAEIDVRPDDETMRAFHKGTLLSISVAEDDATEDENGNENEESEEEERLNPLGVDPYLAVPNIVLLHNEQRLKAAGLRETNLSHRQRGPRRKFLERASIVETEDGLSEIAGLLAQHLPNVFHYSSERRLQKRGHQSRGLEDLETFMRLRMDDLSSVLEARMRNRDRWTAVLGIAVGVVTAFLVQQAIEGRPLWLIVPAAGALLLAFAVVRNRLF